MYGAAAAYIPMEGDAFRVKSMGPEDDLRRIQIRGSAGMHRVSEMPEARSE